MASKVIGFRVPEDLAEELKRICEQRGMTVAEFLRSLVDETLYPGAQVHEDESDNVTRQQVESLSSAHRDLANKVQDLSAKVDRVTSKVAGYELKGILSPDIVEKIQEIEKINSNKDNLKSEVDTLTIKFEAAEKNIGNFSGFVLSSESLFAHLQKEIKSLHSQLESMASSSTRVSGLETEVNRLATTMTTLKREIKRQPTDEIRTMPYKDGSEHRFRVYKSEAGLKKPRRVTIDPGSGDKYIDETEPLN